MNTILVLLLSLAPVRDDPELTSGRPVPPGQACYDVTRYELHVRVDPRHESIQGRVTMTARLLEPTDELVLDLDGRLDVDAVEWLDGTDPQPLKFKHAKGEIRVKTGDLTATAGGDVVLRTSWHGEPRVAPNAPWDGGFVWSHTASGEPWIATANQMQGADLWWPCKDQPDDEPDGMRIEITVPEPLVAASNGRLAGVREGADPWASDGTRKGWRTYEWEVTTPINAYGVALNLAPYETITRPYTSVAGDTFEITYWVLPENRAKGEGLMDDVLRQMAVLEGLFGPYPFRGDKYGLVETPHLGMEHQSIIAYGNQYHGNPWGEQYGFDMLHLHEFAHEWWANLVTCRNWNDFWIHEGFASYAQALTCEKLVDQEAYFREMAALARRVTNRAAVAPREPKSTAEMYYGDRPGSPGNDVYMKGAWILHTLRWVLEDEVFFQVLRRFAYPDPESEKALDGRACRFATTDELLELAERISGRELDWFFEVYLRQAELPTLEVKAAGGSLKLSWKAPGERPFPMPVEVRVGERRVRVECPDGVGTLDLEGERDFEVDPRTWILKAGDGRGRRRR
jgi:aminopeptidase N